MEAAETEVEAAVLEVLTEVAGILETAGLQEEAELSTKILVEFVVDSQKKDKLLCSQLQVVDFLQNFLAQEDTAQDPLASEDTSRQKAIAAKEQWKELKATYREHVEAIKIALSKALTQMEEAQKKQTQLQEAFEQLQAKKQMAMEKRRAAQKQWQLQQEKHLQHLAEVSAQGKLLFPEAATEAENIPNDKPQQLTGPEEQSIGDTMGRDPGVSSKSDGLQPAGDSNLPWLPGGQQHGERS
ncbi:outer kinetochore KNL1 complex subunit ZWINT isoform X6 [Callithrix jacchus]|uniref:ZW10 interactor isoform X3 n=1 Tax=Callithrix jacchus TaxID=9483 RepID=UPI0004F054D7|nr:ZW10 interactor isoform X3 [Callithrix jacchus]